MKNLWKFNYRQSSATSKVPFVLVWVCKIGCGRVENWWLWMNFMLIVVAVFLLDLIEERKKIYIGVSGESWRKFLELFFTLFNFWSFNFLLMHWQRQTQTALLDGSSLVWASTLYARDMHIFLNSIPHAASIFFLHFPPLRRHSWHTFHPHIITFRQSIKHCYIPDCVISPVTYLVYTKMSQTSPVVLFLKPQSIYFFFIILFQGIYRTKSGK